MRISTFARLGLTVSGALLVGCGVSDKKIKTIGLGEARQLHTERASLPKTAMFVDARPPSQYAAGHISGAVNWRLDQFKPTANVDPKIEEYRNIIVYGNDPASPAARGMTKRLMEIGYEGVRMFGAGYTAWAGSKLPIEPPESPAPAAATPAPAAAPAK